VVLVVEDWKRNRIDEKYAGRLLFHNNLRLECVVGVRRDSMEPSRGCEGRRYYV
jgi:hypothetical protein